MPFDPFDPDDLRQHFEDHGDDFGANTAQEYEAMADAFMARMPVVTPLHECVRNNGMICRYDTSTQEYAVKSSWGYIMTYFKPKPRRLMTLGAQMKFYHDYPTNWDYFVGRC